MANTNPSTDRNRMDTTIKAKWLEALRSGRYAQAREVLRDENDCFCCLGVLADLIDSTQWSQSLADSEEAGKHCYPYGVSMETMISGEIRNSVGLSEKTAIDLAGKNDDGESFSQIADYIEANL